VILAVHKCVVKYFGKITARKISTTSSMLPALHNIIVSLLKIAHAHLNYTLLLTNHNHIGLDRTQPSVEMSPETPSFYFIKQVKFAKYRLMNI
jgi:hypothetical protein